MQVSLSNWTDGANDHEHMAATVSELTNDMKPGLRPRTIREYEVAARRRLDGALWSDAFGAPGSSVAGNVRTNAAAFRAVALRPRVMVDVSNCTLQTTVLGAAIDTPVLVAPIGHLRRFHAYGDLAMARAASRCHTVMTISSVSSETVDTIAAATQGPKWFQLYVMKDRAVTEGLIDWAERVGCTCLVITVDTPGYGSRERVGRAHDEYPNFDALVSAGYVTAANWVERRSSSFTWTDLEWIRSRTRLPIVLKGVQTGEDAALCVKHGVDGVVVSNHGGHGLPGSHATLTALPEVVESAEGRLTVLIDGGIRSGADVLKALAIGAAAVMVGRPVAWGLAVDGDDGVSDVLRILSAELRVAMQVCGVTNVHAVSRGLISFGGSPAHRVRMSHERDL
jgi:isopentenyl diphosphate isomerase/L-lactate dehydrogenase-like FMN-dependent dehydrogenase